MKNAIFPLSGFGTGCQQNQFFNRLANWHQTWNRKHPGHTLTCFQPFICKGRNRLNVVSDQNESFVCCPGEDLLIRDSAQRCFLNCKKFCFGQPKPQAAQNAMIEVLVEEQSERG